MLSRNQRSPNVVVQQGRTRLYVTKRSWLDLGTEVQPGDRKYTDYAIPPAYTQTTIDQLTGCPLDSPDSERSVRPAGLPEERIRVLRLSTLHLDCRVFANAIHAP